MKPILACMLSVSGLTLTDEEKRLLSSANPLGITLFKRNIFNKEQIKNLIASVKEIVGRDDVLIAVDQEGGRVCRFSNPNWRTYLSQYALGSVPSDKQKEIISLHGQLIAYDLKELGVNLNYAPVLDISYPDTTSALKSRIFSFDEKRVAENGKILSDIYQQNGICPCIKHLPGHGRAVVDPHLHLPILNQSLSELEKDFHPFITLGETIPAGMTAHIVISEVDDLPVTQSKKAIEEIIRKRLNFKGFLFSDAIDMNALSGSLTERTQKSLQAGCDAVCYCFGICDEMKQVIQAVRPLSDDAYERFSKIKDIINRPLSNFDVKKAGRRYDELSALSKNLSSDYDAVEILHKMKDNEKARSI